MSPSPLPPLPPSLPPSHSHLPLSLPPSSLPLFHLSSYRSKQRDLYDQTFKPIVEAVLQGYNGENSTSPFPIPPLLIPPFLVPVCIGTVFAYGQTGSGKTFTMAGERGDPEKQGLIPNSFDHIFSHIARTQDEQYLVRVSYLEIYKVDPLLLSVHCLSDSLPPSISLSPSLPPSLPHSFLHSMIPLLFDIIYAHSHANSLSLSIFLSHSGLLSGSLFLPPSPSLSLSPCMCVVCRRK